MLFNSYLFIFLFLPLTLIGYYFFNRINHTTLANIFLISMSLFFYGYYNTSYLFIICSSIVINFLLSRFMQKTEASLKLHKALLIVGILLNILVIFYFKYYNFFLENTNVLFHTGFNLKSIILPLGISFYTFQQISYLVDAYRGETKDYCFTEYALFVLFFPQLIAGPIVMHSEIIPQFRDLQKRKFCSQNFAKGLFVFSFGLFKKVIIADTFGRAVTYGFDSIALLSSVEALIVSLSYTFQLFFDFSGYCDMALGLGYMLNIELPQNFNSPYKSTSITDFWSRWHMTLTRFLRTYIYIPLGGNRKGNLRTYANIMVVYLISGIWHGANWTFIVWGLLHGILNCLNRACKNIWEKLAVCIRWFFTFFTINLLWIVFRAETLTDAILFIKRLFNFSASGISTDLYNCFILKEISVLTSGIPGLRSLFANFPSIFLLTFLVGAFIAVLFCPNSKEIKFKPSVPFAFLTVLFTVWSITSLTGISTFLYFGF